MVTNMLYELTPHGYVAVVHDSRPPSDVLWDGYLAFCREHNKTIRGFIVFTTGGGPSAAQRAKTADLWIGLGRLRSIPFTGIVTESTLVRGAVTALFWLSGGHGFIKAFRGCDTGLALDYVQVSPDARHTVLQTARALMGRLGVCMAIAA